VSRPLAKSGKPSRETAGDRKPPFRYIGGERCLDFVNTVDWGPQALVNELLGDYGALVAWSEGAGIVGAPEAAALRQRAAAQPQEAEAAREFGLHVRGVLKGLLTGIATGEPAQVSLTEFNELLEAAAARLELVPHPAGRRLAAGPAVWHWRGGELTAPVWPVVWSAALLLVAPDAHHLRVCAGPVCGWLYVDRSRNHLRRWCEMATCGTRAKSRRRAERQRRHHRQRGAAKATTERPARHGRRSPSPL
jgi:predicted RNA-binding Zn ribbon-like protein